MKEERDSLEANNTWELVNLPQDRKAIEVGGFTKLRRMLMELFIALKHALLPKATAKKLEWILMKPSALLCDGIPSEQCCCI
ncbi:hypothetical protein AVEN_123740-2 [Araneus ventricosus]|nr:hypothetical protein AVEN_123740-2 [Araneus ventricosus]